MTRLARGHVVRAARLPRIMAVSPVLAPTFDDLGARRLAARLDRSGRLARAVADRVAGGERARPARRRHGLVHAPCRPRRDPGRRYEESRTSQGIVALAPDLVLANEEENRAADLDALREAGIAVWVTQVRTVDEAFTSLARMLLLAACWRAPRGSTTAVAAWAAVVPGAAADRRDPRSGGARGWCSAATLSPGTSWPASAFATCSAAVPSVTRGWRSSVALGGADRAAG